MECGTGSTARYLHGMPHLELRGAREHNLDGVDLRLELGRWIAVTGPSGSGKTSLVFDTLVRAGQQRFLGSLSPRARQFFGKLGRAKVDELRGLPPTIAIGESSSAASDRSTVGTQTGALDLLRLLFAREALDPAGEPLTRSHFSFNHPRGACETCGGLGLEDIVDPDSLIADASLSIRDGALVPTLKNGYTVYSQVTLEVMDDICRAHGFDVHTPWDKLNAQQRDVILFGTTALKVPFGKHPIESRMRWEGITARPREEGYYRGLVPVLEETLKRNRNDNVLRFVRSGPCRVCAGSRLGRVGREARMGVAATTLPQLLALPCEGLPAALAALPSSPVLRSLVPSLGNRLRRMEQLGLGHLSLDRRSPTLSGGETQRLRLAAQLTTGLGRMLIALDEPTLGLHPEGQAGMGAVLEELRELGNTLLVVEHDPDMVRRAEHWVALGPGAGVEGGRVVQDRKPPKFPLGPAPVASEMKRKGVGSLRLTGASLHNLQNTDLEVHFGALNVVLGPSGAGKSSLVFGTLLPALRRETGGAFRTLEGAPEGSVKAEDARPIGRTPRSTPATWSGLFEIVRKRFASTQEAHDRGWKAGHFSYNNKAGRCASCEGLGFQRVRMHLLEDLELECDACGGGRFTPDVLDVHYLGLNIAEVLRLDVRRARVVFADDVPIAALLEAMDRLGLGYLQLGQASNSLSRGEAQRIKLATLLGRTESKPTLLLLDEPDRGLHPSDVELLLRALDALVNAGHTVLAISHHRHLWAAADYAVEVRAGVACRLDAVDLTPLPVESDARRKMAPAQSIELRGVCTHNLRDIDVEIPHGKITVLAGVSGSGKTSLAFDTLVSEAWQRFSESLPFQVRRFARRMAKPDLREARGLGPTLGLRQEPARASVRSTVATMSELGPLLRLLWSRAGTAGKGPVEFTAEHFNPARPLGACVPCEGRGRVLRCDPDRLVTHPTKPLAAGAFGGTRVGKFFTEPEGQHLATLRAAAPEFDWELPWEQLPEEAKDIALDGAGAAEWEVQWRMKAGAKEGKEVHNFRGTWDGFLSLATREATRRATSKSATAWAEPLVERICEACSGARLRPEIAAVRVGRLLLSDVMAEPLESLGALLLGEQLDRRGQAVLEALGIELKDRIADLCALGLGHLSLDRPSRTLSDGELQRTRLAGILRSGMTGVTYVLDEPSSGLHVRDVGVLMERLRATCAEGNTVVLVSHRPAILRAADTLIELGPGAGPKGGELIAVGAPELVLQGDGPTARALRQNRQPPQAASQHLGLTIRAAVAHNLKSIDLDLPLSGFVAITGVSGSGKSSLLFDVIGASIEAGQSRGCREIAGFERFSQVRNSRKLGGGGTPLAALGLMPALQQLFHNAAEDCPLPRQAFSYLSPKGRCETCSGRGRERISMDFLADLALPCPACDGARYRPEVLEVQWKGRNAAQFLGTTVMELVADLPRGKLRAGAEALMEVGLGHIALGRERSELSGGEAQRLSLAESLLGPKGPTLFLMDEPASGLHEADLSTLVAVFRRLCAEGHLILASEHRRSLVEAADMEVELGPGGGPGGGKITSLRSQGDPPRSSS